MDRYIYEDLLKWKKSSYRKPLILYGARQVGKSFIITEFGHREYEDLVVFNCDKDERIAEIFDHGFRISRILSDLEILAERKILPGRTLIFFDE